jgi:hypothetical protein
VRLAQSRFGVTLFSEHVDERERRAAAGHALAGANDSFGVADHNGHCRTRLAADGLRGIASRKSGRLRLRTITDIQPEIHQRCFFKFTVAGVEHHGQGDGCSPLGVGAELPVTYLPTDPTFGSTRNPGGELLFEILGPLGLAIVGGIGFGFEFANLNVDDGPGA